MVVSPQWPYYEAIWSLYWPSYSISRYDSGLYNAWLDESDHFSAIALSEKLLIPMGCVFAACWNRHSSHVSGYLQYDNHHGSVIVPFWADNLADMDVVWHRRWFVVPALTVFRVILVLGGSLEINLNKCISEGRFFSGYGLLFRDLSLPFLSHVPKRLRAGLIKALPSLDVIFFSCGVYWGAANIESMLDEVLEKV